MSNAFHAGEIEVQTRAGVRETAEHVGGIIHAAIPAGAQKFLHALPMIVVGAPGADRKVWSSQLFGAPGFLQPLQERTLRIGAPFAAGDPLASIVVPGAAVGLLAIDFAARQRLRVNGRVLATDREGWTMQTDQVYVNCPKYIQARSWSSERNHTKPRQTEVGATSLQPEQQAWIRTADTFFIATAHPIAGADVSHRGGMPGFVRVLDPATLAWDDYPGNNMFQSLGNLAVDSRAGLLFPDFRNGSMLQLTGRAEVRWTAENINAHGAERVVRFHVEQVVETVNASTLRWHFLAASPFNPPLSAPTE